MSKKLFLDTSCFLTVGLLNDDFSWVDYKVIETPRSASNIHPEVHSLLESSGSSLDEIDEVYLINGPGSYTGIRISEGVGQILELADKKIYSFHHFVVPQALGIEKGHWVSNAFKGEYFLYSWEGSSSNKELVAKDDCDLHSYGEKLYSHFEQTVGNEVLTSDLVKENPRDVFTWVKNNNLRERPFYFRSIENEFKVKNKK